MCFYTVTILCSHNLITFGRHAKRMVIREFFYEYDRDFILRGKVRLTA